MSKKQSTINTPDADERPPPSYAEVAATPPFNPNYPVQYNSPPHTPNDGPSINYGSNVNSHQPLYPQVPPPSAPPIQFPQPQHYQPQSQQPQLVYQARYQSIPIPLPVTTNIRQRQRLIAERRRFPMAAIFFLFGWFCPPLWVIGACCCAGSRNEFESFWGKVNFVMVIGFIVLSILYSLFAMSQYMSL